MCDDTFLSLAQLLLESLSLLTSTLCRILLALFLGRRASWLSVFCLSNSRCTLCVRRIRRRTCCSRLARHTQHQAHSLLLGSPIHGSLLRTGRPRERWLSLDLLPLLPPQFYP